MKLRSNLGFMGDKTDGIVSVQLPGTEGEILNIQPEDYKEFISFLNYLNSTNDIENSVFENQKEYLEFLKNHDLVYDNFDLRREKNPRLLNFVNNFTDTTDRYLFENKTKDKTIVIIGLGTLGTAILHYLIQMGMTNFILIDGDIVESQNLYHQRYYSQKNIGEYKVTSLKEELSNNLELNIKAVPYYLSDSKQLGSLLEYKSKENIYIFCALDNLNKQLVHVIEKIGSDYPTYIAGYNRKSVFATRVSSSFIKDYEAEVKKYDIVKDNSGLGFLGDLTASLMLRLWLQKFIPKLDYGLDYLEYSLFDNETSFFSNYLTASAHTNITDKNFFFNYVLESQLNNLYSEYLSTSNKNSLNEIKALSQKFNIDIEEIDDYKEDFKSKIRSLSIEYNGNRFNIENFYNEIMPNITMTVKIGEKLDKCLSPLESDIVSLVNQKKKLVRNNYIGQLNKLEKQIPHLLALVHDINNKFLLDNDLDFLNYKPQNSNYKVIYLSDQVKEISLADNLLPNYSLTQYIEFINNHSFLKVSRQYKTSFTSFDKRYNVSTSFVKQEDNLFGLLTLGHEIGHNYFNSFIESPAAKVNMSTLTAESFAFINESLITLQIMNGEKAKDLSDDFLLYIYQLISVPFSMDLYQKNVFTANDINLSWNNIIEKRVNTVSSLFPGKNILNLKYSNHNIAMNDEFLFNKTEFFIYPRAYSIGFFISNCFINNPDLYTKFVRYISKKTKLDIALILEDVFNVSEDKAVESGTILLRDFLSCIYI